MSVKVKLTEWAARHYTPAPSLWTLRRWVREQQIQPAPEQVGKAYYVEETAVRVNPLQPRLSLVERLKARAAA